MQLQDQYGYIAGESFEITLIVHINGPQVTITIPTINTPIPSGSYPYTGCVIVTVNNFLPKCLWPKSLVYQSFSIKPDNASQPLQDLTLYVGNDGSIRIGSTFNSCNVINEGYQITTPTTITYILENFECQPVAPKNVQVSNERSNAIITGYAGYFLEFYDNAIVNDTVAICWSSNSKDYPTTTLDQSVAVGKIVYDSKGRPQLVMNQGKVVVKAIERAVCVEQGVAINPANVNNIATATPMRDRTTTVEKDFFQGWSARTTDGGNTWISQRVDDKIFTAYRGRGDWNIAADKYGNFWYFGMYNYSDGQGGWTQDRRFVGYAVSSDGGATFKEVGTITPVDDSYQADYPRISFGGDGKGGYGAWVTSIEFKGDFSGSQMVVGFFPIFGLGNIGPITYSVQNNLKTVLGDSNYPILGARTFAEILATPDGKVYIIGEGFNTTPLGAMYISSNLTGLNNFGPDSFGKSKLISYNNVNLAGGAGNIIYNGSRGGKSCSYRLGYDIKKNRIYMGNTDQKPARSGNMMIDLIYSDDNGNSWNLKTPISDTDINVRDNTNLGYDYNTGNILFSWYDARGDPTGESVNMYAAILNPDNIKYHKSCEPCKLKPIKIDNESNVKISKNLAKARKNMRIKD